MRFRLKSHKKWGKNLVAGKNMSLTNLPYRFHFITHGNYTVEYCYKYKKFVVLYIKRAIGSIQFEINKTYCRYQTTSFSYGCTSFRQTLKDAIKDIIENFEYETEYYKSL